MTANGLGVILVFTGCMRAMGSLVVYGVSDEEYGAGTCTGGG
jgi:hypothetical protein